MLQLKQLFRRVFFLILVSQEFIVQAQNCELTGLKPDVANPVTQYKRRDNNRCEGLVLKPVSSRVYYTLKQLLIGNLQYELISEEVLRIKTPKSKKIKQFSVIGNSFQHPKNYRLDMSVAENTEVDVPLKEVILPNQFMPSQLGFYIKMNEDYFAPLKITSYTSPKVKSDTILTISFYSGLKIKDVNLKYAVYNGLCGKTITTISFNKSFETRQEIIFEISLNSLPELKKNDVDVCFELNAKDFANENDLPTYQFKVFLPQRK
jgi:hypothetical protein